MPWSSSRPDRVQDHVDIVPLSLAARRRAAEIAAEDGRERAIVGKIEVTDRGDGDVEIDRIEPGPEHALGHAALERGKIEPVLVAEIVIDHPLVGAGAARDLVDASAREALFPEFVLRGGEDGLARAA